MRPGETLSLTVTLPNEQHIEIPEAVVQWSGGAGSTSPLLPQMKLPAAAYSAFVATSATKAGSYVVFGEGE